MFRRTLSLIFIISIIISCINDSPLTFQKNKSIENVENLFETSRNNSLPDSIRKKSLIEANENIEKLDNDSLKIRLYVESAYNNLILGNLNDFRIINHKILQIASINKDSIILARAYSNLGYYYRVKYINDSSFYFYNQALKYYHLLGSITDEAEMRYNLAAIQSDEKDFIGSEVNTIKAISILKKRNEYHTLFLCYNNLAFIAIQFKDFEKSIEYRKEGLEYLSKLKNVKKLELIALNGIGIAYLKKGDYINSNKYFNKALSTTNIYKLYPDTYAVLIDNLAYSKFKLGQRADLPKLFYKSLKIRDSLQIIDGVIISNLHLSEYFLSKKDSVKSLRYALKAKELAKSSNNYRDLLESYLLLSKLETNMKRNDYLQEHIRLTDSLQQNEREIREKFTRIAYETGEIEKENVVVTKRNGLLTILILVGGALFTMIFIYIRQRSKNKELIFSQKQEEANTEIYNLMISEKTKFNEGSLKERVRISEELHDGIVNKLFGTRLSLSLMNSGIPEEEILQWDGHIESLQEIEEEIRTLSHDLKVEVFNIDNTFEKMVEELVEKRSKLSNFETNLDFDIVSDWENISNKIKIHCYRTLQETLHNIHKYAKATKVSIHFSEINGILHVEIMDNGIGFNPNNKTKGIGLKNIESRIEKLNGEVKFISSPENGTKISMIIPLVS